MKKYNPNETKQERKARKAIERQLKESSLGSVNSHTNSNIKYFVICLKWGNKYSADYVNKLYSMVSRNISFDFEFVCFTENSTGIDKGIRIEPLPKLPVQGWWFKPWFFSKDLPIKEGTILYLDLDLIVFRNIDKFFHYKPECDFVIIRDFNRQIRKDWDRMNSSAFRFTAQSLTHIYEEFEKTMQQNVKRFHGDQDFMYKYIKKHDFWPDEWIQSYKWEMRGRHTLGMVGGKRNFLKPGTPIVLKETSVAVFHGEPNIHECIDEWPRANWY
jgi:hypothetical protein